MTHLTRPAYADAIGAAVGGNERAVDLTQSEVLVLMCVAYFQPITRAELSSFFGKEISRDLIGHLRGAKLIASGPRSPTPGAPYTYASGLMTMRALEAAKALEADRIGCAVLHVPTIKPLDTEAILAAARRSGRLVVAAENHTIIGGLGEGVAALLMRERVTPVFRQIALPDEFLDAGALPTLHDRYGISTSELVRRVRIWSE